MSDDYGLGYDDTDGVPCCARCGEACHWCEQEMNDAEDA